MVLSLEIESKFLVVGLVTVIHVRQELRTFKLLKCDGPACRNARSVRYDNFRVLTFFPYMYFSSKYYFI